jgi:hypothetical protein
LDWFGVPCELRAVDVYLVDPNTQIQTGPHVLVAKWALKPHVGELKKLENVLVFGMSFLTDNHISMVLQGAGATMTGYLSVADP